MVGGPVGERRVPRRRSLGPEFGFLVPESLGPEVRTGGIIRVQLIIRLSWFGGPRSQRWAGGGLVGRCIFWVGTVSRAGGLNQGNGVNGAGRGRAERDRGRAERGVRWVRGGVRVQNQTLFITNQRLSTWLDHGPTFFVPLLGACAERG